MPFTGGINLADEYIDEKIKYGKWKDTGVRVTGRAVNSFTMMFFNIWNAFRKDKGKLRDFIAPEYREEEYAAADGASETVGKNGTHIPVESIGESPHGKGYFVQPYDDSPLDRESVGETVYLDLINRASKYLYIFTPYLILDDFMRTALCNAAKRGVDVRIVTPESR